MSPTCLTVSSMNNRELLSEYVVTNVPIKHQRCFVDGTMNFAKLQRFRWKITEVFKNGILRKCLKNYLNDKASSEQYVYLFSYLIAKGIAWNLTEEIKLFAEGFIAIGLIDKYGKILVYA